MALNYSCRMLMAESWIIAMHSKLLRQDKNLWPDWNSIFAQSGQIAVTLEPIMLF